MEATICQVADSNLIEINDEKVSGESISSLTSVEMSFVGGGLFVVSFN